MRQLGLFLVMVGMCLGVGACDEENPVKPTVFRATIQVKTPNGDPVKGLRVGLVNDTPYFQDGKDAARASVRIQFTMATPGQASLSVEDIEGHEIRILLDDLLPAGQHQVVWDGNDNDFIHQPSGRYTVHLVVTQEGTGLLLYESRTDMMMAMLDSSRVPTGYTDANGKLVLRDKKLFPHLYDLPDMTATNENGETIGILTLTATMRISLTDTLAGRTLGFEEDILAGTVLQLVWDPQSPKGEGVVTPGGFPAVPQDLPPVEFHLGLAFPNPFN